MSFISLNLILNIYFLTEEIVFTVLIVELCPVNMNNKHCKASVNNN